MKVRWNPRAAREYDAVAEYIEERNEAAAERFREDVEFTIRLIGDLPQIAHLLRRDRDGDYRMTIVGSYRLVYRINGDFIEIRRVLHVRRDYEPMTIRDGSKARRAFA